MKDISSRVLVTLGIAGSALVTILYDMLQGTLLPVIALFSIEASNNSGSVKLISAVVAMLILWPYLMTIFHLLDKALKKNQKTNIDLSP